MSQVALSKFRLLMIQDESRPVLEALQAEEIVSFTPVSQEAREHLGLREPSSVAQNRDQKAEVDSLITALTPYAPAPKNMHERVLGAQVRASLAMAENSLQHSTEGVREATDQLRISRESLEKQKADLQDQINTLSLFSGLSSGLGALIHRGEHFSSQLGFVPVEKADDCLYELEQMGELVVVERLRSSIERTALLVVSHTSREADLMTALGRYGWSEFRPADLLVHPREAVEEMKVILTKTEQDIDQNTQLLQELAMKHLPNLKLNSDALQWKIDANAVIEQGGESDYTYYLEGVVPKESSSQLQRMLRDITPHAQLEIAPLEDENITLLRHSALTRPFANIVSFFGYPTKHEVDPTPFVAPFFLIFFAFCLTDAGYGLILTLLFGYALTLPLTPQMRSGVQLMVAAGITTIIMGVLFGGYFGMTPDQFGLLRNPETGMFYGQLFDPVQDLVPRIMILAYGLGVLQILLGVVLSMVTKIRRGDLLGAYMVSLPTALIVILGLFWAYLAQVTESAVPEVLPLSIIGLFLVVVMGAGKGNIFVRPLLGIIIALNEVIGWLSNVLSYSRLFALGLATGIIGFSFNTLAIMASSSVESSILSFVIAALILVLGHGLNLALNFIGAVVHTARLQFVEFFGQFYEGGGRLYEPFRRRLKYVFPF